MEKELVYLLVVIDGDKEVFRAPLGYEVMEGVVSNYPDKSDSKAFFEVAAKHPASTVRENVAYKDQLNEKTLTVLSKDHSINVLRNLTRSTPFKTVATNDLVLAYLKLQDRDITDNIASNLESFEQIDVEKIASTIAQSKDPSMRRALAGAYNAPKKFARILLKDSDSSVVMAAKDTLS